MINSASGEKEVYRQFFKLFSLLSSLLILGTVGFIVLEGWSVLDAFYMAVITMSTIGYSEIRPLSSAGRVFNSLFILTSVGVGAYSFAVLAQIIVEGELKNVRIWRRMNREIERMKGHTIVCGYGRLAENLVKELIAANKAVIVIENDMQVIQSLSDQKIPFVSGSAYEDETLNRANIVAAANLLTLLSKDSDNVYTTLCARELNPQINIIARSEGGTLEKKLRQAGANGVISPYRVAGLRLARQISRPHVTEFLELSGVQNDSTQLTLEEITVPNDSHYAGKTLLDLQQSKITGAFVAAIITKNNGTLVRPKEEVIIESGSTLIVLGKRDAVDALGAFLSSATD